jgi:predicted nucleic acid-binding protein
MVLVDSDILIDLFRRYEPALDWLDQLGNEWLAVPGYVAMEVVQGCRDSSAQDATLQELGYYQRLWLDLMGGERAFQLYCATHLSQNLGVLDALIAQTAIDHDLPLHTFDLKHYKGVSGLRTVQPYTRS